MKIQSSQLYLHKSGLPLGRSSLLSSGPMPVRTSRFHFSRQSIETSLPFTGAGFDSGTLPGRNRLSLDLCLCTVKLRGFLAKLLRVDTYIFLAFCDTLQTIKELLWQATLRSNKNFFKTSLPLCSPPPELRGVFFIALL